MSAQSPASKPGLAGAQETNGACSLRSTHPTRSLPVL